jgi:hypothetical protein
MTADATDKRPVDPESAEPIGPLAQPGYYPGFSTLGQQRYWDEATRKVVLERVEHVPGIRHFTPEQARLLTAVCEHIVPQDDRDAAHRIAIVPWIDRRLHADEHDGYRYASMPPDREAYRLGLQAIDEIARQRHGLAFVDIGAREQDEVLRSVHDARPDAGDEVWERMPAHRFWLLLVADCVEAYYAHPWAWDEIGFGGPAYPRAYMRLERGLAEPWEVDERRYAWRAPPSAVSGVFEPVGGEAEHLGSPGQGGTH